MLFDLLMRKSQYLPEIYLKMRQISELKQGDSPCIYSGQ